MNDSMNTRVPLLALGIAASIMGCSGAYDESFEDSELEGTTDPSETVEEVSSALAAGPRGGILCPTTIRLSNGDEVGPVTAELTDTHSVCRVTNPPREYGPELILLGPEDTSLFSARKLRVWASGSRLRVRGYSWGIAVTSTSTFYTCPTTNGSGQTSAGSWHGKNYTLADARLHYDGPREIDSTDDITDFYCSWKPLGVAVDFPRLFGDTRDVSTNLSKTGFYRNYHMDADLWQSVCLRDCTEKNTCTGGTACWGLGEAIGACIDRCVADGW